MLPEDAAGAIVRARRHEHEVERNLRRRDHSATDQPQEQAGDIAVIEAGRRHWLGNGHRAQERNAADAVLPQPCAPGPAENRLHIRYHLRGGGRGGRCVPRAAPEDQLHARARGDRSATEAHDQRRREPANGRGYLIRIDDSGGYQRERLGPRDPHDAGARWALRDDVTHCRPIRQRDMEHLWRSVRTGQIGRHGPAPREVATLYCKVTSTVIRPVPLGNASSAFPRMAPNARDGSSARMAWPGTEEVVSRSPTAIGAVALQQTLPIRATGAHTSGITPSGTSLRSRMMPGRYRPAPDTMPAT